MRLGFGHASVFSQLLLWAVPLLDPRLRAAANAAHLVLAGSCLPDLALVRAQCENGSI